MKEQQKDLLKLASGFVVVGILFLGLLFLFALIAHQIVLHNEERFDKAVFDLFAPYTGDKTIVSLMKFFSFFGKPVFLIPFYLLLLFWLFVNKRKLYAISVLIIGTTSTGLLFLLKNVFKRERPDLPLIEGILNYSFPSGHALLWFVLSGIFVFFTWKSNYSSAIKILYTCFLLLFALLVGISRVVLRVHYASDVVAGFCLGLFWVTVSFWIIRKIEQTYP